MEDRPGIMPVPRILDKIAHRDWSGFGIEFQRDLSRTRLQNYLH